MTLAKIKEGQGEITEAASILQELQVSLGWNISHPDKGSKAPRLKYKSDHCWVTTNLKTLDTIANCQRLALTVGVSQHMHKITKLWKFEINRSSKLRNNSGRWKKKHPCHTKLCTFRCLISRPQILNLRSRNQTRRKLLLSQKLRYFRGSRISQCFILSIAPHYLLLSKVLCWQLFWVITNSVHCLLTQS